MDYHFSRRLNALPEDALSLERREILVQMIDAFVTTGSDYLANQIDMQLKNAELYGGRSEVVESIIQQDWSWQQKTNYIPRGYRHRMFD